MALETLIVSATLVLAQPPKNIPPAASKAPKYGFTVVGSYPHDVMAYTQGLEHHDGFLYEGTGLKGRSTIRKVELETGKVAQQESLPREYFGEGITLTAGKLFQVTWQDHVGFVYDARTFRFIQNFSYPGEGWGLTHDEGTLVLSDGTSTLRFLDQTTFKEQRRITVTDAGVAIAKLNELEWVRGEIWANVWETDYIVRISPNDGRVVGWINLQGLLGGPYARLGPEAVLNGIAYDVRNDRLFVTGKLWPRLFEIRIKS
jgi:glutamine cyclotransferase